MPFVSKNPNKKPGDWKFNKNGTPRKHGDMVKHICSLKPETIEEIEKEAKIYSMSKSAITRHALEYYFREKANDSSIENNRLRRLRALENNVIEKKLSENGDALGDMLSEMKCIGRNINQITKKVNEGYGNQSLAREVQELYALKSEIEKKINDFAAWMIGFCDEEFSL